jgi:surfactin synthase thioesterase subunit
VAKPKPIVLTFSGRVGDGETVDLATVEVPGAGDQIDRAELHHRLETVFHKIADELSKAAL